MRMICSRNVLNPAKCVKRWRKQRTAGKKKRRPKSKLQNCERECGIK
jgi:hypothetical protein